MARSERLSPLEIAQLPKIPVSEEEIQTILFDTFEMSEGSSVYHREIFRLLGDLFPTLDLPSFRRDGVMIVEFLRRNGDFLGSGTHHKAQPRDEIIRSISSELNDLRMSIVAGKFATPELTTAQAETVFVNLLRRDEHYFFDVMHRPHTKIATGFTSYVKKYCIDECFSKNVYVRDTMATVQKAFFQIREDLMQKLTLPNTAALQQYTSASLYHFNTHIEDTAALRLFRLARAWEKRNLGRKFWERSARMIRM